MRDRRGHERDPAPRDQPLAAQGRARALTRAAGFRTLSHTADVGLEISAPALAGVYEQAALALAAVLGTPETLRPDEPFDVEARGADREDLLVRLVNELLVLLETEGRYVTSAACVGLTDAPGAAAVRLRCGGGRVDRSRERRLVEVKSATYHRLSLREDEGGGWSATLFLDL